MILVVFVNLFIWGDFFSGFDWSGGGAVPSGARDGIPESPLAWGISAKDSLYCYWFALGLFW